MIQIGNFLINFWVIIPSIIVVVFLMIGIRFVRPVDSVLVERFGKFVKKLNPGFNFIIPIIESAIYVNMTENMVDVPPQTVITRDKLNVEVDAVVYYRVADANKAIYNIKDYKGQLISLARTTLRALLGKMTLSEANENRKEINAALETMLSTYTTMGKKVRTFEQQYADYNATKYGVMSNSGSSANLLSVAALVNPFTKDHLKPGDEVIVPDFTFIASGTAVEMTGAKPVFVDVNRRNFQIDLANADPSLRVRLVAGHRIRRILVGEER